MAYQSLFGKSSPILDMAFLLSAKVFEEIGHLEFHFKINHNFQLYALGQEREE